ncbi:CLUMA_CG000015, isoform A [Clunio marinus]|uniref:XK-related protein n=1 Tax=Clunio marinus TaxID=568069 RepID=A0A1J1HE19_9DIPT|nr:CLUMA_CG000015, isoform A [Clunio marinus]
MAAMEFLPICDNLFNVISFFTYFCDCVFDIVLGYALLERGKINFFITVVLIISGSLILSQIVSLKWYLKRRSSNETALESIEEVGSKSKICKYSVIGLHFAQFGIFWRYAKLFVPVDLRFVKHEVRDLCILRLIHAFCEAAPMLLIQCYILMTIQSHDENNINAIKIKTLGGQLSTHLVQQSTIVQQYHQKNFKDLNAISASLSLFSVCWALASFSKNVRVHNVHRFVLTWLGVIFQFFWRLGTVTSRVLSLTAYASVYKKWIFLVIILHWISMFLWLISPKNAFHGEQISRLKKILLSGLIAFVYVFAYINLQEVNHKQKMTIFYIVMFLENCLLVSLWMVGIWPDRAENWYLIPSYVLVLFFSGIFIMFIYYKYFHIRRMGYQTENNSIGKLKKCVAYSNVCRCNRVNEDPKYANIFHDISSFHQKIDDELNEDEKLQNPPTNEHLKGIFNCRFSNPVNNATKRKKKKPTTFIPPPVLAIPSNPLTINMNINQEECQLIKSKLINVDIGPMSIPFWRQPLPRNSMTGGSSETEGSVASSRINIQLKLQEKKQKQLAELKIIEEEIKQGKLSRQKMNGVDSYDNDDNGKVSLLPRQPAPRSKKHINIETIDFRGNSSASENGNMNNILHQLQVTENMRYNNFSQNGVMAVMGLSNETLTSINIGEKSINKKQPSASSTMTSTTSENDSITRQMVASRNLNKIKNGNNLNIQTHSSPCMGSPICHYDPRHSTYNSLEGKNKSETQRSSNSKNEHVSNNNINTSSIEKEKNLASQLIKRQMQRGNTPEILLSPNHLDRNVHYYQHLSTTGPMVPVRSMGNNSYIKCKNGFERAMNLHDDDDDDDDGDDSENVSSDIDSQMSLPRSYTLPREFKFNRDGKKVTRNENFVISTNSSDGDVDSCDDNEFEEGDKTTINQRMKNRRTNNLNKNRLQLNSTFSNINPNITSVKHHQNSYETRTGNFKVNNLDLLNGCIDSRFDSANLHGASTSRQNRSRMTHF